jgi:cyclin-dependent kinase 12/13
MVWGTRQVDCYSRERQVGEGTYGRVWMARDRTCGTIVALKRIRQHRKDQGLPPQAIREIRLLRQVEHHAIVRLLEIVTSTRAYESVPGSLFLVFEYIEHDLSGLLDHRYQFSLEEIKCFMHQLLDAVQFLHSKEICHRDIKCSNLLISNDHRLKVTDFGLARQLNKSADFKYTNKVVTLWYRPPELLLGECQYGCGIDLWSVGCIFVEMFTGVPLFPGKTDAEQMDKIMEVCGTPTAQEWPRVAHLPRRELLRGLNVNGVLAAPSDGPMQRPHMLDRYLSKANVKKDAAYLIRAMLAMDPSRRITATAVSDVTCNVCA